MIKYTSLFLLIVFTVLIIGCQTFLPDYDNGQILQNKNDNESNRVSFFDSAKQLLKPDFDNQNDSAKTKIPAEKNTERYKQSAQTPSPNDAYRQQYAYGNSLSANRFQTISPTFYQQYPPNVNANLLTPQNNFVTKNTNEINSNPIQSPNTNLSSADSSNGSEQVIAKNEKVEIKNENISSPDLISSNDADSKSKSNSGSNSESNSNADSLAKTDLKSSQSKTIKKYAADPLLPQEGDSEYFRLFLKELATIPPDKLKVDETELAERIETFRNENAAAKNSAFETIALGNLRADILPDFLANKKLKKNNKINSDDSDLDSEKTVKSSRKSKIEQVSYSEEQDSESDNNYCNDNSGDNSKLKINSKSKNKLDNKNAPLPDNILSSRGKKNQLSPIHPRGSDNDFNRNLSSDSELSSLPNQSAAELPKIPQLPNTKFANSQPANSQPVHYQPVNMTSDSGLSKNFQSGDQGYDVNSTNKFVSYPSDQASNIVAANYMSSGYGVDQNMNSGRLDNWELSVRRAIAHLRHEMETSYESRIFSNEVKLRLLELSVGNRGEAIKPFGAAEKQISEFWADQVLGLTTIMDDVVIPNRFSRYDSALTRFDSGVAALRQVCPLRLKNVQIIQDGDYIAFGSFKLRSEACKPDEFIVVYFELENPTIKNSSDGYAVRVNVGYEIIDAESNVVQKTDMGKAEDIASVQKRDHFIKMYVYLKKNLPSGNYKLRIQAVDLNCPDSQKVAEEQISFKIAVR
ncbi:MAG: hypothetical protein LBB88_05955 [Planctomycetaceae bacterium]|jgi:SWI/SNF-related matrix-associated actin-dependent regulator of chromatin subfamily A protein 2/4|nr:hypothetical protein [Planctomycetaceae bacterium]